MRFKPRTDLERVFDALAGNYFLQNERDILYRQLKNLDLFHYKKPSDFLKKEKELMFREEKKDDDKNKNRLSTMMVAQNLAQRGSYATPNNTSGSVKENEKQNRILFTKPIKPWVRRMDLNVEAQGILSDFHVKTHFKAAEEIAEKKSILFF